MILFVQTAAFDPNGNHHIMALDVVDGKKARNSRVFAVIAPGLADEFRVDIHGNIFTSSADSVQDYTSEGTPLGKILVPEKVGNLTFGGPGHDRLYIAASSSLYSLDLKTRGEFNVHEITPQTLFLALIARGFSINC
jgi:gluconolactonase